MEAAHIAPSTLETKTPPPQPQNVWPQAVAAPRKQLPRPASQRFAVGDLVEAAFHAGKTYYDGVVVAARADGGNGFLYRIEYDDGDRAWVDESWEVRRLGPPAEAPATAAEIPQETAAAAETAMCRRTQGRC